MRRLVPLLLGLGLVACGGGDDSTTAASASTTAGSEQAGTTLAPSSITSLELAEGVTEVRFECDASAGETCNAVDDDCSGIIDDPCGYGDGQLQVTAAWATGVDIDLYVTDPTGETISFQRTDALDGGRMDRSARGQCNPEDTGPRVEDVVWKDVRPPSGTYEVALHYWGECMANAGPTDVTLALAVGHQVIGTFAMQLVPNQRAIALRFDVE